MPYVYANESVAEQKGWRVLTQFTQQPATGRYQALAERDIKPLKRKLLSIFVKSLQFISCGAASINSKIREWKTQAESGKVTSYIFCRALTEDYTPTRALPYPEIVSEKWGEIRVKVNGEVQRFKDVVILPSSSTRQNAEEWDWDLVQANMQHRPGVTMRVISHWALSRDDVPKPNVIILTRGREGALQVHPRVPEALSRKNVQLHVVSSNEAVAKFRECIKKGLQPALFFHSTC